MHTSIKDFTGGAHTTIEANCSKIVRNIKKKQKNKELTFFCFGPDILHATFGVDRDKTVGGETKAVWKKTSNGGKAGQVKVGVACIVGGVWTRGILEQKKDSITYDSVLTGQNVNMLITAPSSG